MQSGRSKREKSDWGREESMESGLQYESGKEEESNVEGGGVTERNDRSIASVGKFVWSSSMAADIEQERKDVTMTMLDINGKVVARRSFNSDENARKSLKRGSSGSLEPLLFPKGGEESQSAYKSHSDAEGKQDDLISSSFASIHGSPLPNFSSLHSSFRLNQNKNKTASSSDAAPRSPPGASQTGKSNHNADGGGGGYKEIVLPSDSSVSSSEGANPPQAPTAAQPPRSPPQQGTAASSSALPPSKLSTDHVPIPHNSATPPGTVPCDRPHRRSSSTTSSPNQSLLMEYLKSLGNDQTQAEALATAFTRPTTTNTTAATTNTTAATTTTTNNNNNNNNGPGIGNRSSSSKKLHSRQSLNNETKPNASSLLMEYLIKSEGKRKREAKYLVASFLKDKTKQDQIHPTAPIPPSSNEQPLPNRDSSIQLSQQNPSSLQNTPDNNSNSQATKAENETNNGTSNNSQTSQPLSREEWMIKEKIAAMRISGPGEQTAELASVPSQPPPPNQPQAVSSDNRNADPTSIKDQIRSQMTAHLAAAASFPPVPTTTSPTGERTAHSPPRSSRPGAEQLAFRAPGSAPSWVVPQTTELSAPQQSPNAPSMPQEESRQTTHSPMPDVSDDENLGRNETFPQDDTAPVVVITGGPDDIVEATPVGENDDFDDVTYATAEAMPSPFKLILADLKVRWCLGITLVISMLLAAMFGTIFGGSDTIGSLDDNSGRLPDTDDIDFQQPSYSPSVAPTTSAAPTIDLSNLFDVLAELSDPQDLKTTGSPQHNAMIWLGNEDSTGIKFSDRMFYQRYAIVVLCFASRTKHADDISDRHWGHNWLLPDKHECDWGDGIKCEFFAGNRYITALDLSKNSLDGFLPPEIGLFQRIVAIDMNENSLRGRIPEHITKLSSLASLNLGQNQISGPLPVTIGEMSSLSTLNLCNNMLTGELISGLWEMRGLRVLRMCFNNFTGPISENIVGLEPLTTLDLVSNHLTGTIPSDSFAELIDLAFIHLDHNMLSGSLPFNGTIQKRRVEATFANNLFTGQLPRTPQNSEGGIGFRIQKFDTSFNSIKGTLSAGLGFLQSLKHLDVSFNQLTGSVPNSLGPYGLLDKLEHLNIAGNAFHGTIPKLGHPERTRFLCIQKNQLTGGLPSYFGELEMLEFLEVGENKLGSSLPTELGLLKNLRHFSAFNSSIGGTLPTELTTLSNLGILYLGSNLISNKIPVSIGNMRSLRELDLSSNLLSGKLPKTIGNMENIEILKFNNNSFRGPIPDEFALLRELKQVYLQENRLSGLVPETICHLHDRGLEVIRVDCAVVCGCCSENVNDPCS